MKISVRNRCPHYTSYRAARVQSLFNAESGQAFDLDADLDIDDDDWQVGVIVGPSGSGKTSMGRDVLGAEALHTGGNWPEDQPIVDAISPGGDFDAVTAALSAVGLGSVPSWLRPYQVLSNGEKFRAELARIVAEEPARVVIDEFTSVVDRQIAKIGALAFQKAWRRTKGKAVLLSCHYDVLDWLEPDWIFDTSTGVFERAAAGRRLRRRPRIELEIRQVDGSYWPLFEPHHYLKLPRMVACRYFVGFVDGEPVIHLGLAPRLETGGVRGCRMVVMPEWQGAGVGMRFLNWLMENEVTGGGQFGDRVRAGYFHTSHPGLCAALRRDPKWEQVSAVFHGGSRRKSHATIKKASAKADRAKGKVVIRSVAAGYGGHFRAVQGFRYRGEAWAARKAAEAQKQAVAGN
jgi:ABC-type ATPase involved in cell division/GNAT superfamily N-acetyltransferase